MEPTADGYYERSRVERLAFGYSAGDSYPRSKADAPPLGFFSRRFDQVLNRLEYRLDLLPLLVLPPFELF